MLLKLLTLKIFCFLVIKASENHLKQGKSGFVKINEDKTSMI